MNCEFCNSPAHVWFDCPKKEGDWKPERLRTKSTAARMDVQERPIATLGLTAASVNGVSFNPEGETTAVAGTQALPVDTKPKFDRIAYQREYMRKWRAAKKAKSKTE